MKKKVLTLALFCIPIFLFCMWLGLKQPMEVQGALILENIEALASNESGGDCSGCYVTSLKICKYWGWGGCVGETYITNL